MANKTVNLTKVGKKDSRMATIKEYLDYSKFLNYKSHYKT